MANFVVATRMSYRDVAGLALDCSPGDYRADAGAVTRWFNRAPRVYPGNARFGDPQQATPASRPLAEPGGGVRFVKASATSLLVPCVGTFAFDQRWTFGFDFDKGANAADSQVVLASRTFPQLRLYRRTGGNFAYQYSGGTVAGVGDLPDGSHLFALDGAGAVAWRNNAANILVGAIASIAFPGDVVDSMLLGRTIGGGDELDGVMRRVVAWKRNLSLKERDFVMQSLGQADHSADNRLSVELREWTDATGSLGVGQVNRLNPRVGAPHLYHLAVGSMPGRVQFACEVNGAVLPDASLGGDLFSASLVEAAAAPVPVFHQDAGWSAVFDLEVFGPGHYTVRFDRANGGSKYVHIDVEAT